MLLVVLEQAQPHHSRNGFPIIVLTHALHRTSCHLAGVSKGRESAVAALPWTAVRPQKAGKLMHVCLLQRPSWVVGIA